MNRLYRLLHFPQALWRQRELWWQLSQREVQGRYRGSVLGWGWSLITPLLMLAVYTFVFSQIFQARWSDLQQSGPLVFAINLFTGLIVFNLFSETANQSPSLILGNANLVTKVIFPLEILPAVTVAAALFHALTSLVVLLGFQVLNGLLLFLSAVFYPLSALPERWQPLLKLNPLVVVIEQTRRIAVMGTPASLVYVLGGSLLGLLACELSYRAFQKARRGFADVL